MIWDWMAQYDKAGLIADLMPYYIDQKFPAWDIEEYPARLVEFLRPRGRMIGIPVGAPAQIMMYRKDLFAEAGLPTPDGKNTTWQQIHEWAKKLNKPGVAGAVFGWKAGGIYTETMNVIPAEKPLLDQDKRLSVYRDPRVAEVYEIWARMYSEGLISQDVLALNIVDAWAKFQSGQAAMQPLSWPIAIATMEDPEKSQISGKVGYTETPGGTPRIGGWGGLVLADAKNKEAAYLHLAWIASIDTTVKEVLRNGNYNASTTKHFRGNVEQYKPEILKRKNGAAEFEGMVASWAGIDKGRLVHPGVPEFATIGDVMYPPLAKVISGELAPKDGLNQAADAGEKVLAEAGYYK
jgi:multiple sugar transport system substrate-binding protein